MTRDEKFMRRALELARMGWGTTNPNPMVGAVLVRDDRIIGEGFHRRAGEPHAEINALRDAAARNNAVDGATLYVTLEPCSTFGRTPPCTDAIIAAGIARVVIGAADPNPKHAGRAGQLLRERGVETVFGVENAECRELNEHFFRWITSGRPFVVLKLAMTLDGRIACANGSSRWITGEAARRRVQHWRQLADAVMIGGRTMRTDHPQLTVREPANWWRQPRRIVVSRTATKEELAKFFPDGRAEAVSLPDAEAWHDYLKKLGGESVSILLIEGGGELAAAAIAAGAVDFAEFHIAPKLLGGRDAVPALGGLSPEAMADALKLRRTKWFLCGEDMIVNGFLREF